MPENPSGMPGPPSAGGNGPGPGGSIPNGEIGKGPDSPLPTPGAPVGGDGGGKDSGQQDKGDLGKNVQQDAGPSMGAGGTMDVGNEGSDQGGIPGAPGGGSGVKNTAKAAGATVGTGVAAQGAIIMMFLLWLRSLAAMALAALMNLWNMFVGFILGVAKAIGGFFLGIGAGIANLVGGAVSAVSGAVMSMGAALGAMLIVAGSVVSGAVSSGNETAQRDMVYEGCGITAEASLSNLEDAETDPSADTAKNAETIYSVLSAWGMSDENIAGILGNWDAESSIDPTGVETIFDEPQHIGPRKKDAQEKDFLIAKVDPGYAATYPAIEYMGIGLGQWTNDRNLLLQEYSEKINGDWYAIETQLGFMISDDDPARVQIMKDLIAADSGDVDQATSDFMVKWEGLSGGNIGTRQANARTWFAKSASWDADQSLADSILEQSESTLDNANDERRDSIAADCSSADTTAGNVSLTEGGLSMEEAQAWVDLYNEEGDGFLKGRYGSGGPGACDGNKAMNCVSLSTYFANKYTELQQYAPGNGIDTAGSMASILGKDTSSTPTPYSVASGPGSGAAGHTFVVLGVTDSEIIYGEAGYCAFMGRVSTMPLSEATSGKWEYVDLSDIMLPEDEVKTS